MSKFEERKVPDSAANYIENRNKKLLVADNLAANFESA